MLRAGVSGRRPPDNLPSLKLTARLAILVKQGGCSEPPRNKESTPLKSKVLASKRPSTAVYKVSPGYGCKGWLPTKQTNQRFILHLPVTVARSRT